MSNTDKDRMHYREYLHGKGLPADDWDDDAIDHMMMLSKSAMKPAELDWQHHLVEDGYESYTSHNTMAYFEVQRFFETVSGEWRPWTWRCISEEYHEETSVICKDPEEGMRLSVEAYLEQVYEDFEHIEDFWNEQSD